MEESTATIKLTKTEITTCIQAFNKALTGLYESGAEKKYRIDVIIPLQKKINLLLKDYKKILNQIKEGERNEAAKKQISEQTEEENRNGKQTCETCSE